jgi:hypothetical protein
MIHNQDPIKSKSAFNTLRDFYRPCNEFEPLNASRETEINLPQQRGCFKQTSFKSFLINWRAPWNMGRGMKLNI